MCHVPWAPPGYPPSPPPPQWKWWEYMSSSSTLWSKERLTARYVYLAYLILQPTYLFNTLVFLWFRAGRSAKSIVAMFCLLDKFKAYSLSYFSRPANKLRNLRMGRIKSDSSAEKRWGIFRFLSQADLSAK